MVAREFRGITTGVPLAPISLEAVGSEGSSRGAAFLVLRGCARVLARNHAEQPFGGGLRDTRRGIVPSAREGERVESLSIESTAATLAGWTTAWLPAVLRSNSS